ncbi:MAG TPA: sugar phosphate isomerase/epimerase family protein [Methylomirabilota bacterium]
MPSRRTFLRAAGATAAAAVAGANRAVAIEPFTRSHGKHFKLSLAAYSYRQHLPDSRRRPGGAQPAMTLHDFVDECARLGLDGTEPTSYYVPDPVPPGYLQGLRRHAFLSGLTVSGTAIGNTFTHPPGQERDRQIAHTKAWIDHAVHLGAPVIRIFAGNLQKGSTPEQARQWTVEAIRECCEYAAPRGVILALENHGGIVSRADDLLAIVREVESDWFGVNWDSGNVEGPDPYGELAKLAPYAVTAQIKTHIGSGSGRQPADFRRVLDILGEVGYRGWVALEYEDEEDPKSAVPRLIERLQALIS